MSYIDLLDSAKTAHPNKLATEWWRNSSPEIQAHAIAFAKTELMLRVLHGETILLSNNQAFDSVAFLDSVSELARLSFLERPPMALSYFKFRKPEEPDTTKYTPNLLVTLSGEYLDKKRFVFSAWTGLDDNISLRSDMSKALVATEESSKFIEMVETVYLDTDPVLRDEFRMQARSLQAFYDYLRSSYSLGKNVIRKAGTSDRLIWEDLDNLRYFPSKEIPQEAIKSLDDKLISENLHLSREDRSVLYYAIEHFEPTLRENLKKNIDFYYNQKIGSSVSRQGRGVYTMSDYDSSTPPSQEEYLLENAENINTPDGIVGEIALEVIPKHAGELNALTWDDVILVLKEEKTLRDSAYNLQDNLALYHKLDVHQPDFQKKLIEWRKITNQSFEEHQTLLSKLLAEKIKYDSGTRQLISSTAPNVGATGGVIAGTFLGLTIGHVSHNALLGNIASSTLSEVLSNYFSSKMIKAVKDDFETSAVGSVREALKKSVKLSARKGKP